MSDQRRITWQTLFGISGGILSLIALIAWTLFLDRMKTAEANIGSCESRIESKVGKDDFNAALERMEGYMKELREKDDRIITMIQNHEERSASRSRR